MRRQSESLTGDGTTTAQDNNNHDYISNGYGNTRDYDLAQLVPKCAFDFGRSSKYVIFHRNTVSAEHVNDEHIDFSALRERDSMHLGR